MVSSKNDTPSLVWVFMSEFSADGSRGAPTAIFPKKVEAEEWITKEKIDGILYEFPVGVALVDHAEPLYGDEPYIAKHSDKNGRRYRAGCDYLGFTPHHHYNFSENS